MVVVVVVGEYVKCFRFVVVFVLFVCLVGVETYSPRNPLWLSRRLRLPLLLFRVPTDALFAR